MASLIAIGMIFTIGFYLGAHYGYQRTQDDLERTIKKVMSRR